jgi:hypothetical protein
MSIISSIIENINDTLIGSALSDGVFDNSVLVGIVYPYPERRGNDTLVKIIPAFIKNDGDAEFVELSDQHPVTIYHRLQSTSYQYIQEKAVGDNYTQRQTVEAYLIACAWRPAIKMSADDLNELLVNSFPNNPSVMIEGVNKALLLPTGTDFDFIRVFRQEFDKVDYFLKPQQILLQIKYKMQIDVKSSCIN